MGKIVAIHQPNFFPWLGYFDKIARSDIFIFLDDVQFPKKGGVWTNRVKLMIAGEDKWITCPINRAYHGVLRVNEVYFANNDSWRVKLHRTLDSNYRRHPYFEETMHVISSLIDYSNDNVADFNANAITTIAEHLGLDVSRIIRSSDIPVTGHSNELLSALTLALGGDVYMCGGGADEYQDEAIFLKNNLELRRQNFVHPKYEQFKNSGDFVAGLSILDALMNLGFNGVQKDLIGQNV